MCQSMYINYCNHIANCMILCECVIIYYHRVSHLAEELISHLKMTRDDLDLKPKDVLCVKVAGLCHDLGQPHACGVK